MFCPAVRLARVYLFFVVQHCTVSGQTGKNMEYLVSKYCGDDLESETRLQYINLNTSNMLISYNNLYFLSVL